MQSEKRAAKIAREYDTPADEIVFPDTCSACILPATLHGDTQAIPVSAEWPRLWVLSASPNGPTLEIDPQPFIALLFSGKRTDRNKSSLPLFRFTESRDSRRLVTLREKAMQPLIEGTLWTGDPGHSNSFLVILGRIAGIPNDKLQKMVDAHNTAAIIGAAQADGH